MLNWLQMLCYILVCVRCTLWVVMSIVLYTVSIECPCSVSFMCAWIRSHRFHVNRNVYDWTDERSLVRPFDEFPCNAYIRNSDRWLESNGAFYVNVQRLGLWTFYSRCHCHSHLLSISVIHFLCFTLLLLHCHSTHRLPSIANSKFYMTHSLFYCLNGTFFVLPTERPANWIKTKLDECVCMRVCALWYMHCDLMESVVNKCEKLKEIPEWKGSEKFPLVSLTKLFYHYTIERINRMICTQSHKGWMMGGGWR